MPYREKRKEHLEAFVGSEYGDEQREDAHNYRATIMNLMNQTANTYTYALAANNPRILCTSEHEALTGFARNFQAGVNLLLSEIKFDRTMRRLVMDAFFSVGIAKVFFAATGTQVEVPNPNVPKEPGFDASPEEWSSYLSAQNIWMDPGKPFVERVSLDHFTFDTTVTEWEKIRYATHDYRVPYEVALDDPRFDQEVLKRAGPSSKYQDRNDVPEGEVSEDIPGFNSATSGKDGDPDEMEDMITLCDVWLPFERGGPRWAVTIPNAPSHKPLLYDKWTGPENGLFHYLSFGDVPDMILPSTPSMNLISLHELVNSLLRKAARQAENEKTILVAQGDPTDAENVTGAHDMKVQMVSNVDNLKEVTFNGNYEKKLAFAQIMEGIHSRAAGNLDAMAGLGPQSPTAKQDSLIHDAVSKREAQMQHSVVKFVEEVTRDLGWMLWMDQTKSMRGSYRLPGLDHPIPLEWKPEDREGEFNQYQIKVEPYSMAYKSPSERMQQLIGITQSFIAPLMPLIQSGVIDIQRVIATVAELGDIPRITEWFSALAGPPQMPPMSGMGGGGMPSHTQRDYVRHSAPGQMDPQSQRTTIANSLMGGGVNDQSVGHAIGGMGE